MATTHDTARIDGPLVTGTGTGALRANYLRGHRNGYLDRQTGMAAPLQVALTSTTPGYASGYYDGWHGHAPNPIGTGATGATA